MNTALSLTYRNLKLFFRDKASVFFSLLSMLIIVMLYALFLGKIQVQNIEESVGKAIPGAERLVNSWIFAGILAVGTVTVSLGAYGTMVDDAFRPDQGFCIAHTALAARRRVYDIRRTDIADYNLVVFIVAEAYIVITGGQLLSPMQMLETLGILCLSIFSFSSLVCFITSYVKSPNAFGALSTILGTMIGFLTGSYVPVGILPGAVVTVIKCIPFTYSALWLRQVFTAEPMQQVFAGAPAQAAKGYADLYGINMYFSDTPILPWMMALIIAVTGVVFFVLSIWRLSKRTWIMK